MPSDTAEPKSSDTDFGAHLIALITNQDQVSQGWLKFLITLESGLAVGFGFILKLKPAEIPSPKSFLFALAEFMIPLFGIAVSVAGSLIVVRERKWQVWYLKQFKAVYQHTANPARPQVFPEAKDLIGRQEMGYVSKVVVGSAVAVGLAWFAVLVLLLSASLGRCAC
jgi:hypothetical protein